MKADINLEIFLGKDASVLQKHIDLLKAVDKTKSITKAAAMVGISYKNAWDTLDVINNKSKKPLITRVSGNTKNSGSELSEYGHELIKNYELIKKAQKTFLDEILAHDEITENTIQNLKRMGMKLSTRNQLLVTITQIERGPINSLVYGRLSSGETLVTSITVESEKDLELEVGKEVLFLFKAPNVIIAKDEELKLGTFNLIDGTISEVKIGAANAEISLTTKGHQTITAVIARYMANRLELGVGDEVKAIIAPTNIIIGI